MLDHATWTTVDEYVTERIVHPDQALDGAIEATAAAGMPPIAVSAPQGKFLALLAQIRGATRILEVGTLGGYSTIWLARALPATPGARVITLEIDPHHAQVAQANLEAAGVADRVDIRVGPALDTLPTLQDEGPFDLVFIDADKANVPAYFEWSLKLAHPGTVIVVDNVVRNGALVDPEAAEKPDVQGVRQLHELLQANPAATATTIQTVGVKGYDGFTLAVVQ